MSPSFDSLEMVSKCTKQVQLTCSYIHQWKETKANFNCKTQDLIFVNPIKYKGLSTLMNIFLNIKRLVIKRIFEQPLDKQNIIKINLP